MISNEEQINLIQERVDVLQKIIDNLQYGIINYSWDIEKGEDTRSQDLIDFNLKKQALESHIETLTNQG